MIIDTHLDFGDIVYFRNDPDQDEHIVTGFSVRPNGIAYRVSRIGVEISAYDFEITPEKTIF